MNKCYLCGGTEFNKRTGSVRDRPELDILDCVSCGLVFLSSFDHIGPDFYKNSQMPKIPDFHTWLKDTTDDERRFQYLKQVLINRRLLDFGCGTGGFLLKARELVATAHGIEQEICLRNHHQRNGLTVFQNLSDIPGNVLCGGYDIITMFHVLEHIPDPKVILGELSKMLADDGQIIVEVPNADNALLTLYNNEPFSNFTYQSCHLYLFNAYNLTILAKNAGLKINYINHIQRYPVSNHLYWLAKGSPCGHKVWSFIDSEELSRAYEACLAALGKTDTLIVGFSRRRK